VAASADERTPLLDTPPKAGSARGIDHDHLEDISTTLSKGLPGWQWAPGKPFAFLAIGHRLPISLPTFLVTIREREQRGSLAGEIQMAR
jgi:hypothetical protein